MFWKKKPPVYDASLTSTSTSILVAGNPKIHHVNLQRSREGTASLPDLPEIVPSTIQMLHWVVLVHGWLGKSAEMNAARDSFGKHLVRRFPEGNSSNDTTACIIHCATCNNGHTMDGIAAGGKRLAAEINDLLAQASKHFQSSDDDEPQQNEGGVQMTISIWGYSLGGMYGRYALSEIDILQQGDSRFQAKVFVTTATPNLGIGYRYSSLKLPRIMERGIARIFSKTGIDLLLSDCKDVSGTLICEMASASKFIHPLCQFEKRIVCANSYSTDFQVPTATAAFLRREDGGGELRNRVVATSDHDGTGMIVLVAETTSTVTETFSESSPPPSTISQMADRLDGLGWTKIFCDMRRHLCRVVVWPCARSRKTVVSSAKVGDLVSSEDLHREFATKCCSVNRGLRWYFPGGHPLVIANAKTDGFARSSAAGKPVVDKLSRDILDIVLGDKD